MSARPRWYSEEVARSELYRRELQDDSGHSKYRKPGILRLTPWWGANDKEYQNEILGSIINLERHSGMLTDEDQRKALATIVQVNKQNRDASPPIMIGMALFFYLRKRNWDSLRFPFTKGPKDPDPTIFPSREFQTRHPVLAKFMRAPSPSRATQAWQGLRALAYLAAAYTGVQVTDRTLKFTMNIPIAQHPKLKRHVHAYANTFKRFNKDLNDYERRIRLQGKSDIEAPVLSIFRFHHPEGDIGPGVGDSAFPPRESLEPPSNTADDPQKTVPPSPRPGPQPVQAQSDVASTSSRQPPPATALWDVQSSAQFGDSLGSVIFDREDASPVAPSHRGKDSPGQPQSQPQAPATTWDEIRRRSQAQQQQGEVETRNPSSESRFREGGSGDVQFPPLDPQRRDKEKAQKEFDALLNAERKGTSGGGHW